MYGMAANNVNMEHISLSSSTRTRAADSAPVTMVGAQRLSMPVCVTRIFLQRFYHCRAFMAKREHGGFW